jgi:Transcriptional regulator, AbiEi antitoxin
VQQQTSTVEMVVARLAVRSHGVVTRAQLLAAGITPEEIRQRMHRGALIRVHRGVYRVGHRAPSVEATYLAAVWACGDDAVLSGRAAAHLWGILKGAAPAPEVTTRSERRVQGVTTHRARRIETTTHRAIPITTVPRTLVDLAGHLPLDALARACHEAGVKHRTTPKQVEAVLAKRPRARGAGALRAVLSGEARVALSWLERAFLQRLEEAGLPLPQTNTKAGTLRVDCRWPDRRLTVELDSYRYHHSRHAWELDRRREREAHARGDEFRRYTYGDVVEQPRQMLVELDALLR